MKRESSGTPPGSYRFDTSQLYLPAARFVGLPSLVYDWKPSSFEMVMASASSIIAPGGDQNGDSIVVRTTLTKDRGQLPGVHRIETCSNMDLITGYHRLAGH